MKISCIIIEDYHQFKNFELDLTYPEGHPKAGQPLDKVCFIGRNGTGKSTLLEIIRKQIGGESMASYGITLFKINLRNESIWCSNSAKPFTFTSYLKEDIEKIENWTANFPYETFVYEINQMHPGGENQEFLLTNYQEINDKIRLSNRDLLLFSPSESRYNEALDLIDDKVPETNVNEALLKWGSNEQFFHTVSNENIKDFWAKLIFEIIKKEDKFKKFGQENRFKTYDEIEKEFNKMYPDILSSLAALWNQILDKCGLYFDIENAKNPIQLTDNLHAYIKVKATNEPIPYHLLSTGIRNFIFRLGHIFALFFNKDVESGFLLVDEPENSLFPDFKRDLIQIYLDIIKGKNTQFFVATHDPIIASQFEPCERIILDFDEEGFVSNQSCRKGAAPEGDDANDILYRDFHTETMTHKGLEMWNLYLKKRKELRKTDNKIEKEKLMAEISQLGSDYNFSE